ncbi:MAG: autotransporter-associated beta strand repeat-containing protein [Verrucomicrobia bacterium]|nr:autotransporter-associated beta strand repeat-containing protein [Verrucomicrobiota bacterium]
MKSKFRSIRTASASLFISASLCAGTAHAAKTWTGATNANWTTTTNWLEGALPGTTETVNFNESSTGTLAINLEANRTIRGIAVTAPAGDVTINAGSTLTIGDVGINMASAQKNLTIASGLAYTSSALQKWDLAAGRSLTVTGTFQRAPETVANIRIGNTGTVRLGSAAIPVLVDAQSNPYATIGLDDWAATDSTGLVIPASYIAYSASTGTTFHALPLNVTASFTQSGNGGSPGLRFADSATAHTLTFASSTTFTGRGVLVTSNSAGGTITGGFLRPNRSSGGTVRVMNVVQNSPSDFTLGCNLSNSSASTASLLKTGTGKLILAANNSYTSGTKVLEGTVQLGNGGAAGMFGSGDVINNAAIVLNRSDNFSSLIHNISGTGSLTQNGTGEATLTTSVSTFSGPVSINSGVLGVTTMANLGAGTAININGGTFKFYGVIDPSARTLSIGAGGATFDTNGNNVTLANSIGNSGSGSLTKSGAGTLSLAADNTYAGTTTVNAGKLLATGPATPTGTGAVVVNSGASLGGTMVAGAVNVTSGGKIEPGTSAGTLSVGSLDLDAGSTATFEFNTTPANDQIAVATPGGLTIDGGAITLLQEGTASPFATVGTFNLISYSGTIGGTGVSSLSVANPQAGFNYTFGTSGGWVTLTIATSGVVGEWINTTGGSWATTTNWKDGIVPDGTGATANFLGSATGAASVTLDAARTVGAITFNNGTSGYTIAAGTGGSLSINNGTNPAAISVIDGIHEINAPVSLASTTTNLSVLNADDVLTLSGVVSGAAGNAVSKTGPGSLSMLGSNTFAGPLSLAGGATTFANGGLGTGSLALAATRLIWTAGNTQDISDRVVTIDTGGVTFDTNGNDVSLANPIGNSGTGSFTKDGLGTLTLAADPTYGGTTTVNNGVLRLGTGGATGVITGLVTNNAALEINLADGEAFGASISGTGNLSHVGTGNLTLTAANTFTGLTTITNPAATLTLGDPLSLQGSTLSLAGTGGSLSFGILTSATLGGLEGDKGLVLEETTTAPVALTIGSNGQNTVYTGILSGGGSLVKTGAGTTLLTAVNTYLGATTVNTGILELADSGAINGTTVTVAGNATLRLSGKDTSLTASGLCNVSNAGTVAPVLHIANGTATLNGGIDALGNANNGYRIEVDGVDAETGIGSLTTTTVRMGRCSLNFQSEAAAIGSPSQGFYINGGNVTLTGALEMGVNSSANSSVSTRIDAGSLSVAGPVTVGLNNGGRWSVLQVSGGTFTASDVTTGVSLGGPAAGNAVLDVSGGTAVVERIQFGQAELTGTSVIRMTAGSLYLGSGGMVKVSPNVATTVRLAGGTLGAKADWSSDLPVSLTGAATVKAADGADAPFNITLTGAVSGTGSLQKTGGGFLTVSSPAYTGATTVDAGTLSIGSAALDDAAAVTVAAGATLNLNFTGTDQVGSLTINGVAKPNGVYDSTTDPGFISGTGKIRVGPPAGYSTWATDLANGLTAGVNDGPLQDPDNDGIPNLMEYVLGGIPAGAGAANATILPDQSLDATDLILAFTRSDLSETDTVLKVQWSTDLTTWTDFVTVGAADSLPAVDVTESADPSVIDSVVVRIPRSGHESGGKLYGRLKAEKN